MRKPQESIQTRVGLAIVVLVMAFAVLLLFIPSGKQSSADLFTADSPPGPRAAWSMEKLMNDVGVEVPKMELSERSRLTSMMKTLNGFASPAEGR